MNRTVDLASEPSVGKATKGLSSYRSVEARDGVTVKDLWSSDSYFSVEAGDGGSHCIVEAGDGGSGATGRTANDDGCRNFLSVAFEFSVLSDEVVYVGSGESESRTISDV